MCDGLDTLADVYLNDQLIAHTDNMFRQYRWDVKALLRSGENELRVVFHSPVAYVTAQEKIRDMPGVGDFRHPRRFALAQSQLPLRLGLGHACCPPSASGATFASKPIRTLALIDVHVRQHHDQGQVSVSAACRRSSSGATHR